MLSLLSFSPPIELVRTAELEAARHLKGVNGIRQEINLPTFVVDVAEAGPSGRVVRLLAVQYPLQGVEMTLGRAWLVHAAAGKALPGLLDHWIR